MKFVNLTQHVIAVINADGITSSFAPSGVVARVAVKTVLSEHSHAHAAVPLFVQRAGAVEGLPERAARCPYCGCLNVSQYDTTCAEHPADQPEPEMYIVSALVRLAVPGRDDVASPGELVRDEKGQPIACKGLVIN